MSRPAPRPVYFEIDTGPVFGWYHPPASSSAPGPAVAICSPFAWDDVASYRPRRQWAEHLAAGGHPTLRFDWPGTGDSGGSPRDAALLEAWTGAVHGADALLRETSGCRRLAVIGLGLGGLVAWRAMAEGAAVDDLVLWAVPERGKRFVRELRAFGQLQAEGAGAGPSGSEELSAGVALAGGFLFTAETLAAIEGLDVGSMELPVNRERRALLLDRDGLSVPTRLREALQRAGTAVSEGPGPGYGVMTAGPQEARSPLEVFARVSSWLGEIPSAGQRIPSSPPSRTPARPSEPHTIELSVDGHPIRETPMTIEQPFGSAFGLLAEPAGAATGVCAILLNAGAIRRIGPNRMWVEMARRWAALGVPTLRLDLEGIGDADGDAERYAEVAEFYVPEFIDQARAAMDALVARGLPPRFVLCGLCSGAYWSFHAALSDDRVLAAFLLNPRVLFWDASVEVARDANRVAQQLRSFSWRRLVRGVPLARVLAVARWAALAALSSLVRRVSRRPATSPEDRLEHALDQLRGAGKSVVMVFGEKEPLRDELERAGRLDGLNRWPNVRLTLIPTDAHTLSPVWAQQRIQQLLEEPLAREVERAAKLDGVPGADPGAAPEPPTSEIA